MKLGLRSLDCDMARDMMFDYIDGELKENDIKLLEAHIKDCDSCRCELGERREMLELIKLAGETPTPSLYDGVMEKITDVPQEKRSIFTRLRYLPAGTIVAACAVMMVLVVGRGYIFGNASTDAVLNDVVSEDEVAAEGIIPTEHSGSTEAVVGVIEECEPVVYTALLDDNGDEAACADEPEYYSVTTSSITADAPMLMAGNEIVAKAPTSTESAVKTKLLSAAVSELDIFYSGIDSDASAVIVCYDGSLELDRAFEGEKQVTENGVEYVLYTVTEDVLEVYTNHLAALSATGVKYRASVPENESVVRYELYVLVDSES